MQERGAANGHGCHVHPLDPLHRDTCLGVLEQAATVEPAGGAGREGGPRGVSVMPQLEWHACDNTETGVVAVCDGQQGPGDNRDLKLAVEAKLIDVSPDEAIFI